MARNTVRYSAVARAEYRAINKDSKEQFGSERAKRYRQQIQAALRRVADNPDLGLKRDDLAPGVRRVRIESHLVYYRLVDSRIVVSHILHQRQSEELGDWDIID